MTVEVDEEAEVVTVNGRKFTFAFFEMFGEVDEKCLYRFKDAGATVTIEKVGGGIEKFGLKPKHECQVGCSALLQLRDTFKREADNLSQQVEEDNGMSSSGSIANLNGRATAYYAICASIAVTASPETAARFLESMSGD